MKKGEGNYFVNINKQICIAIFKFLMAVLFFILK